MRRLAAPIGAVLIVAALATPAAAKAVPDPEKTPGSSYTDVTQETISTTICQAGYTRTVRAVSSSTKTRVFVRYRIPEKKRKYYVIDHLIPLELGGANGLKNLWPEAKTIARRKDQVENRLNDVVCAGTVQLAAAQDAIVNDWRHALDELGISTSSSTTTATTLPPPPTEPPTTAPPPPPPTEPPAPPVTEPPAPPGPPGGATALCNDGTYSYSQHRRGTCSSHGGVAQFLVDLPA